MNTYLFTVCLSLLLSMGITPLVIELARRRGWMDQPNARSVHRLPVARLGGIAIFTAVMLTLIPVLLLTNVIGAEFRQQGLKMAALLVAATLMFAVGVWDDLYGARARIKLAAQLVAAIGVYAAGIRISSITVEGLFTLDFGALALPLTLIWLIGATNAVNLIDGLDGLAAGISAIACAVIAVLAAISGNVVLAVIMLAMLGALGGFLFFNFSPAKIFMGDCGSLFIGFLIAAATVMTNAKTHAMAGFAVPILVLGIPIFDTFFSMLRRFLLRRAIMSADRGHFHHRLLDLGFSQRHVVIVAYGVTVLISGLGFFLLATRSGASVIVFLACLLLLLLVFRIVGSVRLGETLAGIQRRRQLISEQGAERRCFDEVQLHFFNAETFDQWWHCVCEATGTLQFARVQLDLTNRDGSRRTLAWDNPNIDASPERIDMHVPIPDRRDGSDVKLNVQIPRDGSLESVGRRITYLTRLMEEHGLNSLAGVQQEHSR